LKSGKRSHLENEIDEIQVLNELALEAAHVGTFQWDSHDDKFFYSQRFAETFGLSGPNLLYKDFVNAILPEDLARRRAAHEVAKDTGTLYYEIRVRWPDESIHWIRINGKVVVDSNREPIKMLGASFDMTGEKLQSQHFESVIEKHADQTRLAMEEMSRRNEELRFSEDRYHKMISEVQDYAIILLDKEGHVQNWNTGAEKIKGYKAEEIVGKSFELFYPNTDRESGLPFFLLNQAAKEGRASHEGWRVRKNGTRFWGSVVLTALHGDDGHVIGFSKVTRDLTERKMHEDKLIQTNAELEAQNKELEQFAYVASHDLQEPLRKIQTFADLIKRNKDDAAVDKYFEKIQFAANRMSELIKAVLNYSRLSKDAEEKSNVDLNVVLAHVKSDFELLIQEKHAAIASDQLPSIKGYPQQIGQLFYNLIGNALKFSATEPIVRITWRTVSPDQIPNKPETLHASRYYEIKFTDNGIGFEQEYEDRIFMMFQRLHGRHQYAGTGIGLALCKKIVDLHEGHITAQSEPGKGSVFTVYIPVG
jgi:PAS domain S-box-containing protein